jgi:iron complex outermembrane recepter protein
MTIESNVQEYSRLKWAIAFLLLPAAFALGQEVPAQPAPSQQTPSQASGAATSASPTDANKTKTDEAVSLGNIVVAGQQASPTAPTVQEAQLDLSKIAGGTSLVSQDDVTRGAALTDQDVLAYQPGVYAQAADGNDAIKISIRGSSINRGTGFFRSGILFLFDGLPITGPGGSPFELMEPLGLQYTEILRGANAFDYGPVELGGAINYVTNTGISAPGAEIHLEGGSFGYWKGQLAYGASSGKWDYYVSLTESHRDGYQTHSEAQTAGAVADFGYQFNANVDTRLFFRYRSTYFKYPGELTREEIETDPTQGDTSSAANGGAIAIDAARKQQGSTWVGDKTVIKLTPESQLEVGAVFHDYPIEIDYGAKSVWYFGDVSAQLKYTRQDQFDNHESDTTVAAYSTTHIYAGVNTYAAPAGYTGYNYADFTVLQKSANYNGSADNVILISNDTELEKNLWLTLGLSGIDVRRNNNITFSNTPNTSGLPAVYNQNDTYVSPRVGLRYSITPNWQVYGNFSRSVEPENSWAFSGGSYAGQNYNYTNLTEQRAWASELGTTLKAGIFDLSLTLYHTAVNDELLTVQISPEVTNEFNAGPTTHQGLELGLDTKLWKSKGPGKASELVFRQAYTYSDFFYNNDPVFAHNKLPGLPQHFYQGELLFEQSSGFYVGVNTQAASRAPTDYANSFYTDSYVIFGATAGYQAPSKKWDVYVDLRNLTNKGYAAAVSPDYNDAGQDNRVSDPGDGFGVDGGITFRF